MENDKFHLDIVSMQDNADGSMDITFEMSDAVKENLLRYAMQKILLEAAKSVLEPEGEGSPPVDECGFGDPALMCNNCTCWKNSNE